MKTSLNLFNCELTALRGGRILILLLFLLGQNYAVNAQPSKDGIEDCPAPCPCEGHFTQMQVYYFGEDNATVDVYRDADLNTLITSFMNVNSGQLLTIDAAGTTYGIFGINTYFVITNSTTSCVEEIYSRCPSNAWPGALDDLDVLGKTFGDLTVYSRTDEGNTFYCDISNAEQDWHVGGNIIGASNNTLGTRNEEAVVLITNDQARGTITSVGDFGINTLSPAAQLDVHGDVLINETLDVHGITTIHSGTGSSNTGEGALVVAGGAGIGENLNVGQDTRTDRDLTVGRNTAVGQDLEVVNDASIGHNLNVINNTSTGQDLTVGNDTQVGNDLQVTRNTSTGQDLNVGNNATVNGDLAVRGQAEIDLSLTVDGSSTLNGFTRVNNDAQITQDLDLDGQLLMGLGNSKRISPSGADLLIENQTGQVLVEADNELMMIVSNTQVEVKKRLIVTGGSDLAERFTVTPSSADQAQEIAPGMILSIDPAHPGQLRLSAGAHDRTVAGIVSGAGGVNTAMLLGQSGSIADGEVPVAITGRAYAFVDASYGAIQPGDLLTTSPTNGHAMKVTDYQQSQGAIIGKAMTTLKTGKGLVLVLISLQ